MIMNDNVFLAFMLAMSDQLTDLQQNGNTYPGGKAKMEAYYQVMSLISRLNKNPGERLIPYDGRWYSKEEIDKMFYRDVL